MRILILLAAVVLLVGVVTLRASSADQKPAPELEYRKGPPPAKYAQFVEPGKCLVIRLPDDPPPRYYCP